MTDKKMSVFKRLQVGVKTTFGMKELTPEQKTERERKKREERAFKQAIAEKEREAYQMAYQKELIRQRQLYAQQKEQESIARAMVKARQDVQVTAQPKKKLNWYLTAPARTVNKVFPMPPPAVQKQLDLSLRALTRGGDIMSYPATPKAKKKVTRVSSPVNSWIAKEIGAYPLSAQALEYKLKKHHKKRQHLKGLGTKGVSVVIDGTQITLQTPQKTKSVKHRLLKKKLKPKVKQFSDDFWKL